MQPTDKVDRALTATDAPSTESTERVPQETALIRNGSAAVRLTGITRATDWLNAFFVAIGKLIEPIRFGVISGAGAVFSGLVLAIVHLTLEVEWPEIILLEVWAVTLFFLIESVARWTKARDKYKELREDGEKLLALNRAAPNQLKSYVHMSITKKIEALIDLSVGRSSDCTYPEQIAIANSLAKGASVRFWATSTDKPSVLWAEGISYFNTLADLDLADATQVTVPPGKARLVLLSFDDLFEDYSDGVSSNGFNRFVGWHADNRFALRFYLIPPNEDLREKLKRTVDESDPLKDFLIKDEEFVYGRIETLGGSGVRLRFIPHLPGDNMDTFNSYKTLFTDLWDQSAPREKVLGQLDFERGKRSRQEQVRKDYKNEFIDAPSGENFFKELLSKISQAAKTLYAVDIADKKSSINNWSFQPEYKQWLEACIEATQRGHVDAKRIYIVRAFGVLGDFDLQQVLRRQLQAGFEIVLMDEDNVSAGNLHVDDFLLVDDGLGFTLGPDSSSTFVQDSLEFSKNLIPKSSLETYLKKFDELFQYEKAEHFKGKNDITKFEEFLMKLERKAG